MSDSAPTVTGAASPVWEEVRPQVNSEAEFLEIASDFGNPLEIVPLIKPRSRCAATGANRNGVA
jgi:hypothetical protein